VKNAWNTVQRAREIHIQARKSERSDCVRVIVDTDNPRMTAQSLVNEFVRVLYPCHYDVQLYRPTSLVEVVAIKIDTIRTNHSFTDSILNMLLHLEYTDSSGYIRTDIPDELSICVDEKFFKRIIGSKFIKGYANFICIHSRN
jgi:hypothetical protein